MGVLLPYAIRRHGDLDCADLSLNPQRKAFVSTIRWDFGRIELRAAIDRDADKAAEHGPSGAVFTHFEPHLLEFFSYRLGQINLHLAM